MTHRQLPAKTKLALALLCLWFVASAFAAWNFFYAPNRPFAHYDALSDIANVSLNSSQNQLTAVHFIDDNCPCSRYSSPHIATLEKRFPDIAHLTVKASQTATVAFDREPAYWVPSSPSFALFNKQGKVMYYGPYSAGLVCGDGFDFFKASVSELRQAGDMNNTQWKNLSAFGCYCDWPEFKTEFKAHFNASVAQKT